MTDRGSPEVPCVEWVLEGVARSLAEEAAGSGERVTLVEPGGHAAGWPPGRAPRTGGNGGSPASGLYGRGGRVADAVIARDAGDR